MHVTHSMSPSDLLPYLLFTAVLLTTGCSNDSPVSFVDGYTPDYLDETGTVYDGDYYPFAPGYQWNYDGSGNVTGNMTFHVPGQSFSEDIDTVLSVTSTVRVFPSTSITVSSGTYTVFPIEEMSYSDGEQNVTRRYFENIDGTGRVACVN